MPVSGSGGMEEVKAEPWGTGKIVLIKEEQSRVAANCCQQASPSKPASWPVLPRSQSFIDIADVLSKMMTQESKVGVGNRRERR